MRSFFSFSETGDLLIEKVFLDMSEPILFTCVGADRKRYLCVRCQSDMEGKKWLLAEVDIETIIRLLTDKITIREAFLHVGKGRYTIKKQAYEKPVLLVQDSQDWDEERSIYLPDAGEYMEAEPGEFNEEIRWYEMLDRLSLYQQAIGENLRIKKSIQVDVTMKTDYLCDHEEYVVKNTDRIKKMQYAKVADNVDDRFGPYAA